MSTSPSPPLFIIGPCALESIEQVKPVVEVAKRHGLSYFRANLFKPRTSPHSFQGLGKEGLPVIDYLLDSGMKLVCEACSLEQLEIVQTYASIVQIGARNMQNFELLKGIGAAIDFSTSRQMVMLKRGFSANIQEWLSSADYLQRFGVPRDRIVLCERGSRHWAAPYGMTLDLALAWKVRRETDYRVIVDPSHGTRESSLVLPMAGAAQAMGFDGLMLEVHPNPLESLSDPQQAIRPKALDDFLSQPFFHGEKVDDLGDSPSNHS
ncbi:MAG: hypothetical protein OXB88_08675 [Bacteriovoracales bacterium]|nr:hypothetical protein [Bacteriovoracales bacterium]